MRGPRLQVVRIVEGPGSCQEYAGSTRVETSVGEWKFWDVKGLYVGVRVAVNLQAVSSYCVGESGHIYPH